jgi:hypothetical protein
MNARQVRASGTRARALDLALAVGTTILLLALVWAEPRPTDDLYIALAGARDVLAGRLGAPDDWSFMTAGRVWINQNWGSGLVFYGAHAALGEIGLLLLKAVMLAAAATFLALACRTRGVAWPLAILAAGGALAAGRSYIDLRPNLTSLVLAPLLLWVLYASRTRPRRIWMAVALLAVWGNAHGGFVFGLTALMLWTATAAVAAALRPPAPGEPSRMVGTLLAATLTALALVAFANPFGTTNLTHVLVVAGSPAWRSIAEWVPLFTDDVTAYGSRWEVLLFATLFSGLLVWRAIARDRAAARTSATSGACHVLAFDVGLATLVVVMAIRARRFVPLALIMLMPAFAVQADWLLRARERRWPTMLVAAVLALAAAVAAPPIVRRYQTSNPVFRDATVLARMIDAPTIPSRAAAFLALNGVAGRAYAAWEWEGFLRWQRLPIQVLIGGRAQQVYDEATLLLHDGLRTGTMSARERLPALGVALVVIPMTARYAAVSNSLVYEDGSSWVFVFCDGRHAVIADTTREPAARLTNALAGGALRFPDPASAALSHAMYLASPATDAAPETIRRAAAEAAEIAPAPLAYALLGDLALSDRVPVDDVLAYLARERERLATLDPSRVGGFDLAQARVAVARVQQAVAARSGRPADAARAADDLAKRARETRELLQTWAYDWDPNVF